MSVVAARGNAGGKTQLGDAVAATTAGTGVVLIAVDITDILAMTGVDNVQKKLLAFRRALDELNRSIDALPHSDAQLDQRVTDVTANVAALKAARPTGNL